jgi:hypothetical protein
MCMCDGCAMCDGIPPPVCLPAAGLLGSSQSASPPVRRLSLVSRMPPGTMHRLHRATRSTAASPKDASLPCTPGTSGTVAVQAKLLAKSPLAACHGRSLSTHSLAASTRCWPALGHRHALQSQLRTDSCPLSIVAQARARMQAAKFSSQPSRLPDI